MARQARQGRGGSAGREALALLAVVGVAGLVPAPMLDAPFDGSLESWGGAFYSTAARNLVAYPLSTSWGAMLGQVGPVVESPQAYANHPPLIVWLVAAMQWLLGTSEATARAVPWALSVAAAGAAHLLLRAVGTPRTFAMAGALMAVGTPLWARYASMVDPQGSGPMLSLVLLPLLAVAAARRPGAGTAALLLLALPFGLLFDWPAWGGAGLVGAWLVARPATRRTGVVLLTATGLVGVGLLAWTMCLDGPLHDAPPALMKQPIEGFVNRAGLKPELLDDTGAVLTWRGLTAAVLGHHRAGLSWPLGVLALAATPRLLLAARRGHPALALLLVPGAVGLLYVLVFPQGAYTHDYWQLYLAMGVALPAAAWTARICPPKLRRPAGLGLVVVAGLLCLRAGLIARAHATAPGRDELRRAATIVRQTVPAGALLASSSRRSVVIEHYADRPIAWSQAIAGDVHWQGVLEPPGGRLAGAATDRFGAPTLLPGGWQLWVPRD
jgi:hypothetical protein